jgi:hypothetical protein
MPAKPHRARRITFITVGSVVGVLVIGLCTLLVLGGVFAPATYLQPWSTSYYKQFTDPRMKVVAQAILAPSGHNMQPWTVTLDKSNSNVLYLYANSARLTPAVDPDARQTMVSEGTFLAYLRVAAEHLGYSATFSLFPDGNYNESALTQSMNTLPVARITLARDPSAQTADYASLYLSDTNRAPYTAAALTSGQKTALLGVDPALSAHLQLFTDKKDMTALGNFGIEGTLIETRYSAATQESDRLFYGTEQAKNAARSGFAVEGDGTSGAMVYLLQGALAIDPALNDDAAGAKNAIALTAAGVAHTAAYGLISTPSKTRRDQVEAGILYADFCLHARTLGLVMQPLSQVLEEYPSMAAPYAAIHREYAPDGGTIQVLVRIGTPTTQYPQTMRQTAQQIVHRP